MIDKGAQPLHEEDSEAISTDQAYAQAVPIPSDGAGADQYGGGAGYNEGNEDGERGNASETGALSGNKKLTVDEAQKFVFSNGGFPLLVFLASVVVMIAASSSCSKTNQCSGQFGYAVAVGVISIVISGAYLFLEKKENLEPKVRLALTVVLFLWWVIAAGVLTFSVVSPFYIPGNGYFATWGGLVGTLYMLMNEVGKVREALDRFSRIAHAMGALLVGSLVVMFAGAGVCSSFCSGLDAYAIAAGCISFVFAAVRVGLDAKITDNVAKLFNLFMIVFWLVNFIILTFVGPFLSVSNGYFGTWACLVASILLFNH